MDRRFAGIIAALIIIFIVIFAITKGSGNNSSNGNKSNNQAQPTENIEGQGQTGVKLVEYGDFECPICEAYYQPLKQVQAQFDKQIYFQFRNLPLSSIHHNAFAAARAAEAASLQGKFWQMHDKLYDNQSDWASSTDPQSMFTTYAQQIGLDVNKFKQDYASSQVNDAINADLAAFNKTGQEMATPTFFLDGNYLPNTSVSDPQTGEPSVDKFAAVINAEIAKKTKH